MKFGDYLKKIRKRKKITQENLARSLEVSSVYIHQLETGKVDAPSFDRCQQISSILGVKVEEIWSVSRTERLKRFIEKEAMVRVKATGSSYLVSAII